MLAPSIRSGLAVASTYRATSSSSLSRCPRAVAARLPRRAAPPGTRAWSSTARRQHDAAAAVVVAQKVPHQRVLTILTDPTTPAYAQRTNFDRVPREPRITVLRTVDQVRAWTAAVSAPPPAPSPRDPGIALVPTMGALHKGHLDLVRAAAGAGHDKIVVSIYVNPAQFGVAEDLDSYPQTWDADCAALANLLPELDASLARGPSSSQDQAARPRTQLAIFAPPTPEMYPSGFPGQEPTSDGSFVTITPAGSHLEGSTRPTFFRGVATVCMKLFNIVLPARAFFGQKDMQQTVVLRQLVRDFRLPLDLAVVPTTREEPDGLALSSRNVYLGPRRRAVAPVLIEALRAGERAYYYYYSSSSSHHAGTGTGARAGDIIPAALRVILECLEQQSKLPASEGVLFELDYIALRDPDTFAEVDEVDPARGAILAGAIKMLPLFETKPGEDLGQAGGPPVRLIDNLVLPPLSTKETKK